jgi:DNA repair protein RecO (recombination protein O)
MLARDRGLVLRTLPLGETSRIASILGREHGKLRLVARGARLPRSRVGASLESGNQIEFVFSLLPGRDLGTLREAALERRWLVDLGRLEPLAVGWAVLELLERVVPDGAPEDGILDEACAALEALRTSLDRTGCVLLFYAFELRLLDRLGLAPDLEACRVCRKPPETRVSFDLDEAAWCCIPCAPSAAGARRLEVPAGAVRALARLREAPWQAVPSPPEPRTRRASGLLLHKLFASHVERYRYPRALRLLAAGGSSGRAHPGRGPGSGASGEGGGR